MPGRASSLTAATHSERTGCSSIQALWPGAWATAARGGAIPSSASLAWIAGLVAHCTKYQAASLCLLCADTDMIQPITVGREPPGPAATTPTPPSFTPPRPPPELPPPGPGGPAAPGPRRQHGARRVLQAGAAVHHVAQLVRGLEGHRRLALLVERGDLIEVVVHD